MYGAQDLLEPILWRVFYCFNVSAPQPTGVTIQWTGLLDWNTGLDYWTDIFLVFAHSMVGFTESC